MNNNYLTFAVIIFVTETEKQAVMEMYDWVQKKVPNDTRTYYETFIKKSGARERVVAVQASEKGMSSASSRSMYLIQYLRPQYLVMAGIAAGVRSSRKKKQVELCDVVIAEGAWQISKGKFIPGSFISRPLEKHADPSDVQMIKSLIKSSSFPFQVHIGHYACTSSVVASSAMVRRLTPQFPKTKALDMESYGVFNAISDTPMSKPVPIIAKGISDFAAEDKNDECQLQAARNSCSVIKYLLSNLESKTDRFKPIRHVLDELEKEARQHDVARLNRVYYFIALASFFVSVIYYFLEKYYYRKLPEKSIIALLFVLILCVLAISISTGAFLSRKDKTTPELKYYSLASLLSSMFLSSFIRGGNSALLLVPILISVLYFNRKFIIRSAVASFVVVSIDLWLSLFLYPAIEDCSIPAGTIVEFDGSLLYTKLAPLLVLERVDVVDFFFYNYLPVVAVLIVALELALRLCHTIQNQIRRGEDYALNNALFVKDVELASKIQNDIISLAGADVKTRGKIELFGKVNPSESVCGDFYDYLNLRGKLLMVFVASTDDSGLQSTVFMSYVRMTISHLAHENLSIRQLMKDTNAMVTSYDDNHRKLDLFLAFIDTETWEMTYVTAGDMKLLLRGEKGSPYMLETDELPPLGEKCYKFGEEKIVPLSVSDSLFVISPGVIKARSSDGESFGIERVRKALEDQHYLSVQNSVEGLLESVDEHCGESFKNLDRMVLGLRIKPFC